jgi:MFS family permease
VTLGIVADMFLADEQQHAVAWASLFSCLGAVIGGIAGGPIQQFAPTWRWNPWAQLILGAATQALHAWLGKETRATILLDQEAKKQRKDGKTNVYGPNKGKPFWKRFTLKEVAKTMFRPYQMLMFEPVVLFLSLLSGFADALIFSFFESYGYVFAQWKFSPTSISLILIPLAVSYVVAYLTFFPVIARHNTHRSNGEVLNPEARLKALLYHTVLLPAGLLICAFVATGPPLHWVGVVIASVLIGIANYAIYYATVDYMVAAYGPYSSSATGGNGFMRDFLAGMCALYTGPMYKKLGIRNSYLVLFGLATLFCVPVYVFYFKGAAIRARSKFATKLAKQMEKQERLSRTKSTDKEHQEGLRTSDPAPTPTPTPAAQEV